MHARFLKGDEAEPPVCLRLMVHRDVDVLDRTERDERRVQNSRGDLLLEAACARLEGSR